MVERIPDLVGSKLMEDLESTNQLFRNASRDEIKSFVYDVKNLRILPAPESAEVHERQEASVLLLWLI